LLIQWKAYFLFCTYFNLTQIPATLENVCLYAQFLSRSFKSTDSVRNYISGIKLLHLFLDVEFPHIHEFEFKLVLKGLARLNPHLPRQALPITPDMLLEFYPFLDLRNLFDATAWCVLLFGFFLLARKSNLVPNSASAFDSDKQLCRGDVCAGQDHLIVSFRWSKTIQFGERELLIPLVSVPGSVVCPVKAYNHMCRLVPALPASPAFVYRRKGKLPPFTYSQLQRVLKELVQKSGRDAKLYSSHSLRRGGASWAFRAGVSSELIQLQGDWRSDAYKEYLKFTLSDKFVVSQKISDFIVKS
jgi:hypothetical protein